MNFVMRIKNVDVYSHLYIPLNSSSTNMYSYAMTLCNKYTKPYCHCPNGS